MSAEYVLKKTMGTKIAPCVVILQLLSCIYVRGKLLVACRLCQNVSESLLR